MPTDMSSAPDTDPLLGQVIADRYAILRRIGRGGMGAVYAARQEQLGRDVALKVIRADLAHDPEVVGRFEREARAIARLSDPHIVVVHDFGHTGNTLFLAMELLSGTSLGERLRSGGALSLPSALRVARDICVALEVAHTAGVIHRDLKPDNIMLVAADGRTDYAKVLDFGIAKITGGPDAALTSSRTVLGTPGYVAPDVIMSGMTDDPRADLYAVGVMLFEMLAGRAPFMATSAGAMLVAQASGEPPLVSSLVDNVPGDVVELVRQLTARRPDARPPSARFVIDAIDAIAGGSPTAPLFGGAAMARPSSSSPSSTLRLSSLAGGVAERSVPTPSTGQLVPAEAPKPRRTVGVAAAALSLVAVAAVTIVGFKILAPPRPVPPPAAPVIAAAPVTPPPIVAPVVVPAPVVPVVEPVAVAPVEPAAPIAKPTTKPLPKPKPVEAVVTTPAMPAAPATLTSKLVKDAIVKSVGKAPTCTNTNIKLAPSGPGLFVDHCPSYKTIDGDHQVVLTIDPSGEVTDARFTDDASNTRSLGACVLSSLKLWRFPAFAGEEPVKINQKVTFEPCVPINNVCVF